MTESKSKAGQADMDGLFAAVVKHACQLRARVPNWRPVYTKSRVLAEEAILGHAR